MSNPCPVCRFPGLTEPPRSKSGGASFEICPCCGFQFGVSDDDDGKTYVAWRRRWKEAGMRWFSKGRRAPAGWDPAAQLKIKAERPTKAKRTK